ncbi:MAG: tetratricopeptide repeat protein [Mucinivorans sp.]
MFRKFPILICLLFCGSILSQAQNVSAFGHSVGRDDHLRGSYMLLSASGSLAAGDVRTSYELLSELVKSDSTNAVVRYYLAKTLLVMGRDDQALVHALRAVEIEADNYDFLSLAGQLLINVKQYDKAQAIFEELITVRASDSQNYVLASALAMDEGHYDKALEIANKAETLFGFDERTTAVKRAALIAQKHYYEALEYMQKVVESNPLSVENTVSLGDINAGLGLHKAAIEMYERAVALDSTRIDGHMALIKIYSNKGDWAQYIATIDQVFAMSSIDAATKVALFEKSFFTPSLYRDHLMAIRRAAQTLLVTHTADEQVRLLYGRFLTYIGQIQPALEHYQNMLQAGLASRELYNRIMAIYFYNKNYKQAYDTSTDALGLWPDDPDFLARRISALWLSGDVKSAVKQADRAIKIMDSSSMSDRDSVCASFYSLRGDIFHDMDNDKKAFKDYERALILTPNNALVLNNFAYYLALLDRDLDRALQMADRACTLQPDFPTYMDTKAWVLFKLGQFEAAAAIQKLAMAFDETGSSELMLHYGDILYALGDDFMARNYWKKALEAGADDAVIKDRMARAKAVKNLPE